MRACWLVLMIGFALLATGCAETRYALRYETPAAEAKVWPDPPETPRFRYVGELTGEQNLEVIKGTENNFGKIWRKLVGLGDDAAPAVVLQRPQTGITDAQGRVYVSDVSRQAVYVFDPVAGRLYVWTDASVTEHFASPIGIALGREGSVLVVDAQLGLVAELAADGTPRGSFGRGLLKRPSGIARDPVAGKVYVADTHGHDIKVFDDAGQPLSVIGRRGIEAGEFNSPTHLAFGGGRLYVTDTFNTRVQVFDAEGNFLRQFGRQGVYVGDLVRPKGVAVDRDGNVYVIESFNDHLLVFNSEGEFLLPIGGTGAEVGQFYLPSGVWIDHRDRVYIADMFNGRVVILQYLGGG